MSMYGFNPPGRDSRETEVKDNIFLAMRDALLGLAVFFTIMWMIWTYVRSEHSDSQYNLPVSTQHR
jgi:hypothetical protein